MRVRLNILDNGHGLKNRIALKIMGIVAGTKPDDVVKTSIYRPGFFGRPWLHFTSSVMRGRSDWKPGERELIGAFVSQQNTCRYCLNIHMCGANLTLNSGITQSQLVSWRSADFEPRIKAVFELLEKLMSSPESIMPGDIKKVKDCGVSASAIKDALYICFLFNTINRLANAFDYDFGTEPEALKIAKILNRIGYRVPGFLLR